MFGNNFEQEIIEAIQKRLMLEIQYRKVSGEFDEKVIAPYDLYPDEDKEGYQQERLLGCSEESGRLTSGFSTYLENIEQLTVLDRRFLGEDVKEILNFPDKQPYIERNW